MKRRIAALLSFVLVLCTCMNAMAASYSAKWVQVGENWQVPQNGVPLKNTWILDDECDTAGGLFYLLDENGNMVTSKLVKDGEGRYYTFNDQRDGTFGAMRVLNGTYHGEKLTFSTTHDGSYGSIKNTKAIKAIQEKFGVREMPKIKNNSVVRMSEVTPLKPGSSDSQDDTGICSISFNVNLSSANPSSYETQYVKAGEKAVKPASPSDVNKDKEFMGWTEERDGEEIFDFENTAVTVNTVLFAKWQEIPSNYLTFTAQEENSGITLNYSYCDDIQYRLNGGSWTDYTKNTQILLANTGDSVQFRGEDVVTYQNRHFSVKGKLAASGSVTSLTDGHGVDEEVVLNSSCYEYMFADCAGLTSAPELPAKQLAEKCYRFMFQKTGLAAAPALPATELTKECYYGMFMNCEELETPPQLPAVELKESCYRNMFQGCTSMEVGTSGPESKQFFRCPTVIPTNAVSNMFGGTRGFITTPTKETTYYNEIDDPE